MPDSSADSTHRRALCAVCQTVIPTGTPGGQCPYCLLRLASVAVLEEEATAWEDSLLDAVQVRQFGDYKLLEEIARGGMGVVYRAWQHSAEREVAVKMIVAGQLATPATVARFQNEAAAAARLIHPHIVPVYEFGEHETQHFFSMRFIQGKRDIAHWARALAPEKRFQVIAHAMSTVARAVSFAHEHGVLHRDLKPSNILIDEYDQPQITDFGLAKLLDAEDSMALTLSSAILGSPSYMAPEQADPRGRSITTATDVHGLGAVLYELLCARPPFTGETPLSVIRRVVEETPRRLPGVPQDLDTLCRKCLAKDPRDRYASAAELADELERFARGEAVTGRALSTLGELRAWSRRKPTIAALLAALVFAWSVALVGILWQWRHAERANTKLRASVTQLEWRRVVQLLEGGDNPVGMAQLARLLRADPANPRAASLAISVLEQGGFAVPAAPELSHGPASTIIQARLSADEQRIATAGSDGTARLWEAATSRPLGSPMHHDGPVRWVEFSADGGRLATASDDGTARIWDAQTGAPLSPPLPHGGKVVMAKFGGARLATISTDGMARIWPEAGDPLAIPLGAPGRALAWSPDGAVLYLASAAGVEAWRADASELFASDGGMDGLALSPDGSRLVAWSSKGLRMWDSTTGEESPVNFEQAGGLLDAAWTPDGKRLAGAANGMWARIWDAETGHALTPRLPHLYACACVAFSPDGATLLSGGHDGVARRWVAATGAIAAAPLNHPAAVMAAEFSTSGSRMLAVAHAWSPRATPRGGTAQLWDLRPRGPQPWRYRTGATGSSVAWSSRGTLWATSDTKGSIAVHEAGQPSRTLSGATRGWGRGLQFLPDDRQLYVASTAGEISVWSLQTGERSLGPIQVKNIEGVRLFPDGLRLAIGEIDGVISVWDLTSGTVVAHLPGHRYPPNGIAIAPDGRSVASAGEDGVCNVSDATTGEPLFPPIQLDDEIVAVQYSHDGRWFVTASHDRTARQWDAKTGAPRGPAMRHDGELVYAEYSPDDSRILSADRSGNARLWSAATGQPLSEPLRHGTALRHACFSPDGHRFVTEDHDGLRLWETATGEPLTLRQPHRSGIGIGFDAPSECVLFSPDGQSVLHGTNTADALLWHFPTPPTPAPPWLPDLLEAIAALSVTQGGELAPVPPAQWLSLRERLRSTSGDDFYARWVREYCGEPIP